MECPSCQHISPEEAAKFCSQCGVRLHPSATPAPVADSENNLSAGAPEEALECGGELKEEGSLYCSPGSTDYQENPDEPCSDGPWTVQKSKKKRKRSRKKRNEGSASPELDSLSLCPSSLQSLNSLSNLESQDTALPQSQRQQGGPGQPSQPLGTGGAPLESDSPFSLVHGEIGDSALQGQAAGRPGARSEGLAQGGPPPQGQVEGKDQDSAIPSGAPQEGAGPTTSAREGHPGDKDAAPRLLFSESGGGSSEPKMDPQSARQQAEAPAPGAIKATTGLADSVKGASKEMKDKTPKTEPPPAAPPASKRHGQEVKTKDKTVLTGEKAGEKERGQGEDPKKPDGNNRSYAAAVKKEKEQKEQKEQRNQTASAREEKAARLSSPGESIMVYFHAILSKDFGFNPDRHKLFIRGGKEFGQPEWSKLVCELQCTRDLGEHGCLVEGSAVVSKQHLDRAIPYKYVFYNAEKGDKGAWQYEFIYKQPQKNEHVNRCLCIKASLLGSGDWHQYDDIICMRPPGKLQKIVNYIVDGTTKQLVQGRHIAAAVMLDSVFSILQAWDAVNLSSFFTQLQQFFSVVQKPMIYEGHAQPWSSLPYGEQEDQAKNDLWGYLKKQMEPFLEKNRGDSPPKDQPVRSKLRMGLIVLFSVENFNLTLSENEQTMLCYLLVPEASSPDDLHTDLSHILGTSQRYYICLLVSRLKTPNTTLFFFLTVGSFQTLQYSVEVFPKNDSSFSNIENGWQLQETEPCQLLFPAGLLSFHSHEINLLVWDEHLFRSWFSLLPLRNLAGYMETFPEHLSLVPAHVLDCFLGTHYRLQGLREISHQNLKDVESILEVLLHLLDCYHARIPQEALLQSYPAVCLKLHTAVCSLTKDPKLYVLPALSAEVVCRVMTLQPLMDTGLGKESGKNSIKNVFQGTLVATRNWLQEIFKKNIFQSIYHSSVSFTYSEEIEVWRRLVEINFPVEHGWKESLLGDLEGRLKQERPLSQISAYCNSCWDAAGLEDSVAKCFEKCVIEAVSSACQSQTSILERISPRDLRKFGTLVSAVISKSWPRKDGKAVDDLDDILKHLLTGPDVKHLFKLYGSDEKILVNITEDSKKLMAAADSVVTKVAGDLVSGEVLVGQLELIMKHEKQFLDIWQLKKKTLSPQEKKCNMKEVLDWRKKELLFLQRERGHVSSLLELFENVKHLVQVDVGEIAQRHSEDLSSKRLNEAMTVTPPTTSPLQGTTHYHLSPQIQEMAKNIDVLKDSHTFQIFWEAAAKLLSNLEEESEGRLLGLEETHDYLYHPCYKNFTQFYRDLKSGEVTFAEIDVIFKDFVNKYSALLTELETMCAVHSQVQKDWIPERVEQIKEYHNLHQAVRSAKVILKVKEILGLTGDFSVLHTLLHFTENFNDFRHEKLVQINQQLIQAKKRLQGISPERYECLEALTLRKEFIGWVKEALGGITELKVFVDLASISAGENDIDVDRVACFHDAVQGYAPLLYKLDSKAGFRVFMEHLEDLWKALDNDQHLPTKLVSTLLGAKLVSEALL
uniref:Ring finger protein 213 n=1 Tax=Otolemur garnettii TaxID=30611 RepID=H0WTA1_OTOGA